MPTIEETIAFFKRLMPGRWIKWGVSTFSSHRGDGAAAR